MNNRPTHPSITMKPRPLSNSIGVSLSVFLTVLALATRSLGITVNLTPIVVSNLYSGNISLQVSGLTNGEPVRIQKFLDANTNGVVDSTDWLIQQFQIADGQGPKLVGGVTNVNIPYDLNSTGGVITTSLNLPMEGVEQ